MFIGTRAGMVSATMRPPRSCAAVDAESCLVTFSGDRASTVSTFQLSGRRAAMDMSLRRVTSSSLKPSRHPETIASSVVPACCPVAVHSAISSSRVAHRDATGRPSPSECVVDWLVEKPSPPAARLSWSTRTMASTCAGVASLPTASAPIT